MILRYWALFLIFIFSPVSLTIAQDSTSSPSSIDEGIKVSTFVDSKEIPQNRTLTFTVEISWSGNLDRYEIENFDNPVVRNFEIIGTASSNKVGGGITPKAVKIYEFTLRPTELGMGYIENMVINYTDVALNQKQRLVTNRLDVKVIDPVSEPGEINVGLIILVSVLIIICGGIVAILVIRKKRKNLVAQEQEQERLPLEEQYLLDLKNMIKLNDADLDISQSFSQLSRLYRKYLAEKFEVTALGITTEEAVQRLNEISSDERFINSSKEILTNCDLAKFSGGSANKSELERIYTLIESNLERSLRGEFNSKPESNTEENIEK